MQIHPSFYCGEPNPMTTYLLAVVIAGFTYSAIAGFTKRLLEASRWWQRQEEGLMVMGFVFWPAVIAAYVLWLLLTPFVAIGRFAYSLTAASLFGEDKDEQEFPSAQLIKEMKTRVDEKIVENRRGGWES
jgi:predicted anti-sigma-YlaC factor YlaD